MNAGEQMPNGPTQSQQEENQQQVLHQEAQKKDPDGTAATTGQRTWRSELVLPDLERALDALFKAQDHLNTPADRGGDGRFKMIDGIGRSLRGLQRELSK
jgi:hypothetical protein